MSVGGGGWKCFKCPGRTQKLYNHTYSFSQEYLLLIQHGYLTYSSRLHRGTLVCQNHHYHFHHLHHCWCQLTRSHVNTPWNEPGSSCVIYMYMIIHVISYQLPFNHQTRLSLHATILFSTQGKNLMSFVTYVVYRIPYFLVIRCISLISAYSLISTYYFAGLTTCY